MVDEEFLKRMKALGVKAVSLTETGVLVHAEFFPSIPALDMDTLVPPPNPEEDPSRAEPVPRAIANILKRGSVS